MPKYKVDTEIKFSCTFEVEASSQEEAEQLIIDGHEDFSITCSADLEAPNYEHTPPEPEPIDILNVREEADDEEREVRSISFRLRSSLRRA